MLDNSVRTLLIQASMPPAYWVEALSTATYLMNQQPSSSISHELLYSVFKVPRQLKSIYVFLAVCVILTCKPRHSISLCLNRQPACFYATPLRIRGIAASTLLRDELSSRDMSSLTSRFFCLPVHPLLPPPAPSTCSFDFS
jgi:hypothetical protein